MSLSRKKKLEITTPEVGEVVVMRDWLGNWMEVRVKRIGESPTYGVTVEGTVAESDEDRHGRRTYGKFVALPLSHKVETARVTSVRRGKWTVEMPDGTVEEAKSKKAAQDLCVERGVVFQEVSL